jgi:hypothetical protein
MAILFLCANEESGSLEQAQHANQANESTREPHRSAYRQD